MNSSLGCTPARLSASLIGVGYLAGFSERRLANVFWVFPRIPASSESGR